MAENTNVQLSKHKETIEAQRIKLREKDDEIKHLTTKLSIAETREKENKEEYQQRTAEMQKEINELQDRIKQLHAVGHQRDKLLQHCKDTLITYQSLGQSTPQQLTESDSL